MRVFLWVVLMMGAFVANGQYKVTFLKEVYFPHGVVHKEIYDSYFTSEVIVHESSISGEYGFVNDARSNIFQDVSYRCEIEAFPYIGINKNIAYEYMRSDASAEILGNKCSALTTTVAGRNSKVFYHKSFRIDYKQFRQYESLYSMFELTDGAIPIGSENTYEDKRVVIRAISIEKFAPEKDFAVDAQNYFATRIKENGELYEKLKSDFRKMYPSLKEEAFIGNIKGAGELEISGMKIPTEINYSAPDLCRADIAMLGLSFSISTGVDYPWQYDGLNQKLEKNEEPRNRAEFATIIQDLAFPSLDTVLAIHTYEDNIHITAYTNGRKQMHVLNKFDLLIRHNYYGEERLSLENHIEVDNMLLPKSIVFQDEEQSGVLDFNSFEIGARLPESFFEVPDSLLFLAKNSIGEVSDNSYFDQAEEELGKKNFTEAAELYRKALEEDPENPLIFNQLGFCELELTDYYGAIANFGRAIDLNPTFATAHANLAYVKDLLGDSKEAIRSYTDALALEADPDYYSRRGTIYYNSAQYDSAIVDFMAAVEIDDSRADDWYNLAASLYAEEAYAEAIMPYTRSIELNPSGLAYNDRGASQYLLQQYDFALSDFSAAVELNPDNPTFRNNMADALSALGNHKDAIQEYLQVAELDTTSAYVHFELGREYMQVGNPDTAIDHYSLAISMDDTEASFFDARGSAYLEVMDYVAAIDDFSSSLTLYPEDAHIFYLRGMTKIYSSDIFDGCKDLNKAKALGSEEAVALMTDKCSFTSAGGE